MFQSIARHILAAVAKTALFARDVIAGFYLANHARDRFVRVIGAAAGAGVALAQICGADRAVDAAGGDEPGCA